MNLAFDLLWTSSVAANRRRVSGSRAQMACVIVRLHRRRETIIVYTDLNRPTLRCWFEMENMENAMFRQLTIQQRQMTLINTSLSFRIVEEMQAKKERIVVFEQGVW